MSTTHKLIATAWMDDIRPTLMALMSANAFTTAKVLFEVVAHKRPLNGRLRVCMASPQSILDGLIHDFKIVNLVEGLHTTITLTSFGGNQSPDFADIAVTDIEGNRYHVRVVAFKEHDIGYIFDDDAISFDWSQPLTRITDQVPAPPSPPPTLAAA